MPVDGFYAINASKLVIQVDGPHQQKPAQLQIDQLYTHLLEKLGYTVIRITHLEWGEKNDDDRKGLLIQKVGSFLPNPRGPSRLVAIETLASPFLSAVQRSSHMPSSGVGFNPLSSFYAR